MKISRKTILDLGFDQVAMQVANRCVSDMAKQKALSLCPIANTNRLLAELRLVDEMCATFEGISVFPIVHFERITDELHLLGIEEAFLEIEAFLKIKRIGETINHIIQYIQPLENYHPTLYSFINKVKSAKEIVQKINKIFNRFGEIKDDSSPNLKAIRQQINHQNGIISQAFKQSLQHYDQLGFLDDIRESVVDNTRVLAVQTMYRKRVQGLVLGISKTGSISFIEPDSMIKSNRALAQLKEDERLEVVTLLKQLTLELKDHAPQLAQYQTLLTHLDFIRAKALYAKDLSAILPHINHQGKLHIRDAVHPILYLKHQNEQLETIPQSITLDEQTRIIVISGPNAGGKSISLKTVGLIQLMLQSGLLVPAHSESSFCLFDKILTDIGDNQSIENHLSTYSYRLQQMCDFLQSCDAHTLFLIDEFGTGSDPELGGALAEVFLEELYNKSSFGILTTHYPNIKLKVDSLPHATNACMLFDEHTLTPLYILEVGQAGSSFTFEVARKNGIPTELIKRAQQQVLKDTVRLEESMVKLQQEKFKLVKSKQSLADNEQKILSLKENLSALNEKMQDRLIRYQEVFDKNQKYIALGKRMDALSEKFSRDGRRKDLIRDLMKLTTVENVKRIKESAPEKIKRKQEEKKTQELLSKDLKSIQAKIANDAPAQQALAKKQLKELAKTLQKGDRVKMVDSSSVGTLEKIERNKVFVNFGTATLQVDLKNIQKV